MAHKEEGHTLNEGTSFAAPQVTAALQLLMSRYPGYQPEEYITHLLGTARKKSFTDDFTFGPYHYGAGVLDVKALLATRPTSVHEQI